MWEMAPLGDPALTAADKARFLGIMAEQWGEQINGGAALVRSWPRALSVAERGWSRARSGDDGGWNSAVGRFQAMSCHLRRRGIPSSPIGPSYCSYPGDV